MKKMPKCIRWLPLKGCIGFLLLFLLIHCFIITSPSRADDSCIEVIPGKSLSVGDEAVFYGGPCAGFAPLFTGKYEWNFGDDISLDAEGSGVAHSFMRPGQFVVTLKVTEGVLVDPGSKPDSYIDDVWEWPAENTQTFTTTITVEGEPVLQPPLLSTQPVLELNFEDTIADTSGNNIAVQWADSQGGFTNGIEGRALDLSQGGYLSILNGGEVFGGLDEFTISFWFKKTTQADCGRLLDQYDPVAQSQLGQGKRLRFGIDYTDYAQGYYGMIFRTSDGLMRTAYSGNAGTDNERWHHGAISYSASDEEVRLYLDGILVNDEPFNATGTLATSSVPLTIGGDWDGGHVFGGYLDQFKVYNKALTQAEIFKGIVVRHANFQARSSQYISVQLPEIYHGKNTIRLKAFISGGALGNDGQLPLFNKTGPGENEKFLLNNGSLMGSENPYNLVVQIVSQKGAVLFEQKDAFYKKYNGSPKYAINADNAFQVNGKLVFPVMPYGLNNPDVDDWVNNGYVNTLYGHGYWKPGGADFTVEGLREYINLGGSFGVGTIGPVTSWDGMGPFSNAGFANNPDFHKMADYINGLKDNEWLIGIGHQDEPNLWDVSPQSLRAWTALSHHLDNVHPTVVNHMGHVYSDCATDYRKNQRRGFTYENSRNHFGRLTAAVDIAKFDIYPVDAADNSPGSINTLDCYISAIENYRLENGELLPTWASIETADATGANGRSPWDVTPKQLRMLSWINVVHEVKGILWFQYFGGTPDENYTEMARFTRQVNELAPVILGPRVDFPVAVRTNQKARIETMVRAHAGSLYLFAVRVSDVQDHENNPDDNFVPPLDNYPVTATFTFRDEGYRATAEVFEEGREIQVNGSFSDTFQPYDVHIYKLNAPHSLSSGMYFVIPLQDGKNTTIFLNN